METKQLEHSEQLYLGDEIRNRRTTTSILRLKIKEQLVILNQLYNFLSLLRKTQNKEINSVTNIKYMQ